MNSPENQDTDNFTLDTTKTVETRPEKCIEETLALKWQRSIGGTPLEDLNPELTVRHCNAPQENVDLSSKTYEILEELGRGGMGVVFKARQQRLQRDVAIKKLNPEALSDSNLKTFLSEAMITAFLDHPNIVPVYDMWQDGEELSLAMKVVEGENWRERLKRREPSDYGNTKDIDCLRVVCNAIAFAHSKGIAHCDLKPENIMLGAYEEILVMDWGVALYFGGADHVASRALRCREDVSGPFGTPRYMSPELANGQSELIGKATDIYLLGAILHEILVGKAPHVGKNFMAILLHASESLPPSFPVSVPEELGQICGKALSKRPEDRYQSVEEFQDALINYLAHAESARMAAQGIEQYQACMKTLNSESERGESDWALIYQQFGDAADQLRRALHKWEGNSNASQSLGELLCDFARCALENGELHLAETQISQLSESSGQRKQLTTTLEESRTSRLRQQRMAWITRIGFVAVLITLVIGLILFVYFLSKALNETELRKEQETKAKNEAMTERDRADKKALEALNNLAQTYEARGDQLLERNDVFQAKDQYVKALQLNDNLDLRMKFLGTYAYGGELLFQVGNIDLLQLPDGAQFQSLQTSNKSMKLKMTEILREFQTAARTRVSLSPNGRYLAFQAFSVYREESEFRDNLVVPKSVIDIYDLTTRSLLCKLPVGSLRDLKTYWHPTKPRLAVYHSSLEWQIWDVEHQKNLSAFKWSDSQVEEFVWSPDGRFFAFVSGSQVYRCDLKAGVITTVSRPSLPRAHLFWKGERLMVLVVKTGQVVIQEIRETLSDRRNFSIGSGPLGLSAITNDGAFIAIRTKDGLIEIWNCLKGERVSILSNFSGVVSKLAWEPGGLFLATLEANGRIQIFSRKSRSPVVSLSMTNENQKVPAVFAHSLTLENVELQLSRNAEVLLVKHSGLVRAWSLRQREKWHVLSVHQSSPEKVEFSETGRRMYSKSLDRLHIIDLESKTVLLDERKDASRSMRVREYAIDKKIRFAIAMNQPKGVVDLDKGRVLPSSADMKSFYFYKWSQEGEYIGISDLARRFSIWNVSTGMLLRKFPRDYEGAILGWNQKKPWGLLASPSEIEIYDASKNKAIDKIQLDRTTFPVWLDGNRYVFSKTDQIVIRNVVAHRTEQAISISEPLKNLQVLGKGRFVFAIFQSGAGVLWDLDSDREITFNEAPGALQFYSNSSKAIAIYKNGEVSMYDSQTGRKKKLVTLEMNAERKIFWSLNGQYACLVRPDIVATPFMIIDAEKSTLLLTLPPEQGAQVSSNMERIAFLADNRVIVADFVQFLEGIHENEKQLLLKSQRESKPVIDLPSACDRQSD